LPDLLIKIGLVADILPIFFFLLFVRQNNEKRLWVVFFTTFASLTVDTLQDFAQLSRAMNFYLFVVFTIIEYTFFSAFFFLTLKTRLLRAAIVVGSIAFFLAALYNLFLDTNSSFDSISASSEAILIIVYSVFYFYEQLKTPEETFIYSTKSFWITVAILLYLAATLILFVSVSYLSPSDQQKLWQISIIANTTKNLLLTIAFAIKNERIDKRKISLLRI
jgi:hypothetical protein